MGVEGGDHHGYSFGVGDVYLYGHNDGWMYGWYEHSNGHDYSDAEHGCRGTFFDPDFVYKYGTYSYNAYDDSCDGHRHANRIAGRSHGLVGEQYHHD